MQDDDVTNLETEVTTDPDLETEVEETNPDPDGGEPELDELEIDGHKLQVPKGVKLGYLKDADYTQKTQQLAETRKEVEAERARIAEQDKARQSLFEERADLRTIDRELDQLQKIDWRTLEQTDPMRATSLSRRMFQLQAAKQQLAETISTKEQELTLSEKRSFAKLWEDGHSVLAKQVPNWSQDTARTLGAFATTELGYTQEQLQRARPGDFRTLYLAKVGADFLARQRKAASNPRKDAEPVPTVQGQRSSPNRNPDKMSTKEWMRWRENQIAKTG